MENFKIIENLGAENIKLAECIYSIITSKLTEKCQWNFLEPLIIIDGLKIQMNNLKFEGRIEIMYNKSADQFEVYFINTENEIVQIIKYKYIDPLVVVVDENSEHIQFDEETQNTETK